MTPFELASKPAFPLAGLMAVLAPERPTLKGEGGVVLSGIQQDSRRIGPGDLFAARPGAKSNGLAFAADAQRAGAVALLVERGRPAPLSALPTLEVDSVRRAIALAAEAIYGYPSRALDLVGVTGTNGKTTTTFLVEQALLGAGYAPARLGTLGFSFEGETTGGSLTTPEADEISRVMAQARARAATHFVMEVSSHALAQDRVLGLSFEVAAFSNLTRDHLDFHASMADYAEAKARLFVEMSPRVAVVNMDDAFGRELLGRSRGRLISVSKGPGAGVHALDVKVDRAGIRGRFQTPTGSVELVSPLVGEHNLENLLLALGILVGLDVDVHAAASSLGAAPQVPGRLERCDGADDDLIVLVDYAHTPDALERALSAVRPLTSGEVVCVFGCGGDRDPGKRAKMGESVGKWADRALITNDNPRSEDPRRIADAIEIGLLGAHKPYVVELDRARAIEQAVLEAAPGAVVLIAGKGHEPYQIVGNERHVFDDRVEARRSLALRRARVNG